MPRSSGCGVADNEFSDDARDFKVFAVCSSGT